MPGEHRRSPRNPNGLSDLEELFVHEYLLTNNMSKAAKAAGYSPNGSTPTVAANKLMKRPQVRNAILKRRKELIEEYQIAEGQVVKELALLGFSNMFDYIGITEDGLPFTDFSELTREQAAAIQEVTVETYFEPGLGEDDPPREVKKVKLKLYDKRAALVDLGKYLGIFDNGERKDPIPPVFNFTLNVNGNNAIGGADTTARIGYDQAEEPPAGHVYEAVDIPEATPGALRSEG